jgi:hypothetical protein
VLVLLVAEAGWEPAAEDHIQATAAASSLLWTVETIDKSCVRWFELGLKDIGWSCFWYMGVRGKQIERDGVGCSELKLTVRGIFLRNNCEKLQTDEAGGRDCPSNRERHSR